MLYSISYALLCYIVLYNTLKVTDLHIRCRFISLSCRGHHNRRLFAYRMAGPQRGLASSPGGGSDGDDCCYTPTCTHYHRLPLPNLPHCPARNGGARPPSFAVVASTSLAMNALARRWGICKFFTSWTITAIQSGFLAPPTAGLWAHMSA